MIRSGMPLCTSFETAISSLLQTSMKNLVPTSTNSSVLFLSGGGEEGGDIGGDVGGDEVGDSGGDRTPGAFCRLRFMYSVLNIPLSLEAATF